MLVRDAKKLLLRRTEKLKRIFGKALEEVLKLQIYSGHKKLLIRHTKKTKKNFRESLRRSSEVTNLCLSFIHLKIPYIAGIVNAFLLFLRLLPQ